ncbi:hypothetical protein GvMRE_IIg183 [endosymbiont GvMRE of Glomus versiforme]|nr:hypothetical protein GvMRE_IIg183 [endosymbiont GvMRE of Glomus versiforme]
MKGKKKIQGEAKNDRFFLLNFTLIEIREI